jgi:hypothetical protein
MFDEYYQKAPEKIQEVVDSYETAEILGDIAREHHIDVDGFGNPIVGRLTGRVLVGMIKPKDFIPSLEKELGVSNEMARAIAMEVNEKIFAPVKDLLMEVHGLGEVKKEEKQTAETMASEYLEPIPTGVAGITATGLSEKNYGTSHELFEQKLKQSIIQRPVNNKIVVEPMKQETKTIDPYKEDTVVATQEQTNI